MGAIEEVYADLETEVSESEFREAVEQKVEQMDGLLDERAAAKLLQQELTDGEVETVADIESTMDEVKFVAKVFDIGEIRTFERDEGEGRVLNVEVADESGSVSLTFWDGHAEHALEELAVGDVLRVRGRPQEGYRGLEVSVDEAEIDDEATVEVTPDGRTTVDSLRLGGSDVTLCALVLDTGSVRTFDRDDGSTGRVSNLALGDETGRIRLTLWDNRADRAEELAAGTTVEVQNGYVREREGDLELHVGDRGNVETVEEHVEYEPEATDIAALEIDQTADISGVVRSTDPKRTFERDDGSEGQVRNVRLQDDTDDIRVALWGERADLDVAPGDRVLVADAEIEDGWQDDLEASAGWQSTVTVLESADGQTDDGLGAGSTTDTPATDGDRDSDAVSDGGAGLDAFTGDTPDTADDTTDAGGPEPSDEPNTPVDDTSADDAPTDAGGSGHSGESGDRVEFTGTVVQTGDPVVLDDGTETMSVETDATVTLGEEVIARGRVSDGRLDAEEIL
jgi:replication factor A1